MSRKLSEIELNEIIEAIEQSTSYSDALRKLDVLKNGGNTVTIQKIVADNNISVDHFIRKKSKIKSNFCLNCGSEIDNRKKFCNAQCQADYNYKLFIERWKNGEEDGTRGENSISNYLKRFMFEKYNCCCQKCGWNQINEFTGNIPLEIHHIDGDCTNNKEENLELLCPNCHSLTENYKSRNQNCTRIYKRTR